MLISGAAVRCSWRRSMVPHSCVVGFLSDSSRPTWSKIVGPLVARRRDGTRSGPMASTSRSCLRLSRSDLVGDADDKRFQLAVEQVGLIGCCRR